VGEGLLPQIYLVSVFAQAFLPSFSLLSRNRKGERSGNRAASRCGSPYECKHNGASAAKKESREIFELRGECSKTRRGTSIPSRFEGKKEWGISR